MLDAAIRPARHDDLDFLVWTMLTASISHLERSVWETLFDASTAEVEALLRAVATSESTHWCHVDRFWIAEAGGVPAAALSTFDPEVDGTRALMDEIATAAVQAGLSDSQLTGALERGQIFKTCSPSDYPSSWAIENVAVVPEMRGQGVIDQLFAHALHLGRDEGYEHAQIMVLNGNTRAERVYLRNGFDVRADYRGRDFEQTFGCPGVKLLALEY
ncbi:MAG: GNAT family N-acetyltransferase [Acidimicrobiia bacterium]|nr:GNAT family N-acetyltransferase [Acidimicrobiia bacterium]